MDRGMIQSSNPKNVSSAEVIACKTDKLTSLIIVP
jgi:hypothetical protein